MMFSKEYIRKKAAKSILASALALVLLVEPFPFAAKAGTEPSSGGTLVSIPTASEIIAQLKANSPDNSHPRLLATAADFSRIRNNVVTDSYAQQWYQQLKQTAAAELAQPVPTYTPDATGSILSVSRDVLTKMLNLGMVYQLDSANASTYLNGAYKILTAAGNFQNGWDPQIFLDTAEMTAAFGIAYDWFYDGWTDEQRSFIRNAILNNGLVPAIAAYGTGGYGGTFDAVGWVLATSNWTTVASGGLSMGALAIGDEGADASDKAGKVLNYALQHIQQVLPLFQPDGGGYEGTEYWEYNARYFVYYAASMKSALGTDYGLSDIAGVDKTAYYPIYMNGPNGSFNYGDNSSTVITSPILFWFANRFSDPDLAWYQRSMIGNAGGAQDLLWYDPDNVSDGNHVKLDLDKYFGAVDVGSMRSAWNDPNATFVGFKGGDNTYNHADADLGTFMLDALGVRWAEDLGATITLCRIILTWAVTAKRIITACGQKGRTHWF